MSQLHRRYGQLHCSLCVSIRLHLSIGSVLGRSRRLPGRENLVWIYGTVIDSDHVLQICDVVVKTIPENLSTVTLFVEMLNPVWEII